MLRSEFQLFYNKGLNSTLFLTSWPPGDFWDPFGDFVDVPGILPALSCAGTCDMLTPFGS